METYQSAGVALPVDCVLVTQATDIAKEMYLSVLVDRSSKSITFIASAEGGVDIEETAEKNPDAIKSLHVNYVQGLQPYQCRDMPPRLRPCRCTTACCRSRSLPPRTNRNSCPRSTCRARCRPAPGKIRRRR